MGQESVGAYASAMADQARTKADIAANGKGSQTCIEHRAHDAETPAWLNSLSHLGFQGQVHEACTLDDVKTPPGVKPPAAQEKAKQRT